jgi:hypothetical protein
MNRRRCRRRSPVERQCVRQWCIHRCNIIGDQTICVGVLYAADVNIGSCVYYIGAGSMAHCPLFEGIAPDQGREVDLVPCGLSLLKINFNILPLHLYESILNLKLETKTRLNIHFSTG